MRDERAEERVEEDVDASLEIRPCCLSHSLEDHGGLRSYRDEVRQAANLHSMCSPGGSFNRGAMGCGGDVARNNKTDRQRVLGGASSAETEVDRVLLRETAG